MPIGIFTLKNRTIGPVARLFVDYAREVARPLSRIRGLSLPKTPSDCDRRMIAIGLLFVRMVCDYFKSRPQLEAWKLEEFVATMRTGADPGGHELSEKMPWRPIGKMDDEELGAVYEYLIHLPDP